MKKYLFTLLALIVLILATALSTPRAAVRDTCGMQFANLDTSRHHDGVDEVYLEEHDLYGDGQPGIPICAVETYWTCEDDDLAWRCEIIPEENGFTFRLAEMHGSGSCDYVQAKAVVLSSEFFTLKGGLNFWVTEDQLEYKHFWSDRSWRMNGSGEHRVLIDYISPSSIPVVTMTSYNTNADDDFSFYSVFEWGTNNQGDANGNLVLDVADGNSGSTLSGNFYIIEPRQNGEIASYVDENGWLLNGNMSYEYLPFTFHRWPYLEEGNILMFSSLFALRPGDMDFAVSASGEHDFYDRAYNIDKDGNLEVGTGYQSAYGEDYSQFGYQTVFLQTAPACSW